MQSTLRRSIAVLAPAAFVAGLVVSTPAVAAAPSGTRTNFGFDATAYGSKADGASGTESDPTAVSHLPCTRFVPRERSNHLAEADQGGVQTSQVDTRNFTRQANGVTSATSTATVQGGSLAGGVVTFTDLRARNVSLHKKGAGFRVRQFSSVGSLQVAGAPVPVPDDGSTQSVPVPGQGTLVINDKARRVSRSGAAGTVNALKFVGDDGRVQRTAHAASNIDGRLEDGLFRGGAWANQATVAETATTKKGALQPIPCTGTFGEVLETSSGESEETFGTLGARRSYSYGVKRADGSAEGYTRSVVDTANFGALELRNIRGRANVARSARGAIARNAKGTGVGEILINGQAQEKPPAGQAQPFPGGEYTIRVVERIRNGISAKGAVVRLFNATPNNRTDDTVVDLANATLAIFKG